MNWQGIFAIVRKDLKIVSQSKAVMLPLIIVPVVFLLGLPLGGILLLSNESVVAELNREAAMFIDNLPNSIQAEMADFTTEAQRWLYLMVVYQFAPLFLIVPLMISSVIGADSFAGERERKTLEGLIYTPITDIELYLGKMLSAWLPAVAVALVGGAAYTAVVNAAGSGVMGGIFFPNLMWLVLLLWVAPAVAGLGLAAMVLVSARVKTFQEAYQLGSMVVLPVVVLFISQFAGVLYFSLPVVFILGFVVWVLDIALLTYGARTFERGELMARLS